MTAYRGGCREVFGLAMAGANAPQLIDYLAHKKSSRINDFSDSQAARHKEGICVYPRYLISRDVNPFRRYDGTRGGSRDGDGVVVVHVTSDF